MRDEPSAFCERCSSCEANHSVTAAGARFDTTAVLSRATISSSDPHCGHHARIEVCPCRTRRDSVSMVIFVCFAITFALEARRRARASRRACQTRRSLPGIAMKSPLQRAENF